MRHSSLFLRAAAGAAIWALASCATDNYHYSQIVGDRYNRAAIDTYPLIVLRIDGKDTVQRPALVDPGVRQVTVQAAPGGGLRLGDEKTIALEVAVCTRYYLVATKDNRLNSDFEVRIDYQEPVPGCTPPKSS
jgi:hypothetical protein